MTDSYLKRDASTGRVAEVIATVTGGTVGESGKVLALDGTGRVSATVMPVGVVADTYTGNASEALTAGDLVYINASGTVAKASATSGGFDAMGFVLSTYTSGAAALVYLEGRNTAVAGLTVGSRYYLSDSVPGGLTSTPVSGAGKRHQYVGMAITTTSLSYEADDGIVLAQ